MSKQGESSRVFGGVGSAQAEDLENADSPLFWELFPGQSVQDATPSSEMIASWESKFPEQCAKAMRVLLEADAILISCGAGFSADSGLPTFSQIGDVEAYRKMGLNYYGLCRPHWQISDPAVFYGFWGHTLNLYRSTEAHEGYTILRQLLDRFLARSAKTMQGQYFRSLKVGDPYFIYTSNIDHHFEKTHLFPSDRIFAFHGTLERWQCARGNRCQPMDPATWEVPDDFSFEVDPETRLAPGCDTKQILLGLPRAEVEDSDDDVQDEPNDPRVAWQEAECPFEFAIHRGNKNRPRCCRCKAPLRPDVAFFDDPRWLGWNGGPQQDQFNAWLQAVLRCAQGEADVPFKVGVLEMGCGLNVPTIRQQTEKLHKMYPNVSVIRVNRDWPLIPKGETREHAGEAIELMSGALAVLREFQHLGL